MTTGFDLIPLIKSLGYVGIFSTILLENGVPLLFFLPGDTLLLTAGFLAAQGYLNIELLVVGGVITAIFGYMLGYYLGKKIGLRIFGHEGKDTRFLKREHLEKTRGFYRRYGNVSLLLARFLPLRAWVCFLAGVAEMPYRTFMIYNVIGAIAWGASLPILGYYLGQIIPIHDLETLALIPIAGVLFMVVLVPTLLHYFKKTQMKKEAGKNEQPPL